MRVVLIRPTQGWASLNLRELWENSELLFFFTWRDLKVRYKQTAIGAAWAILQPVGSMVVFSLFFGSLARIPSDGIPYPLFALSGLVPWQLFSYAVNYGSTSLVTNERLVTKVYFPRMLLPIGIAIAGAVDFAISFVILIATMLLFGVAPAPTALLVPLFLLITFAAAVGISLWFSALDVTYRDIRYTIPFLTQLWLFATPIVYPSSLLGEPWRSLYGLNPMAGAVEGIRWCLFGTAIPFNIVVVSTLSSFLLLLSGALFFRRVEKGFADVL